ncbi:MAG: MFS transporter, partial [Lachnospiraceae bacterium]|nr:MFS transporter [Lachnospiraceae bacterium]
LVMMISIINTVEYNELKHGTRDEAIITSMRPFLTKLSSSVTVIITTVTYLICNVTLLSNQISDYERKAEQGLINATDKSSLIAEVIKSAGSLQTKGLLLAMTVLPCAFMLVSVILYRKFYKIDEEYYDEICKQLEAKKN